MDRILPDPPLKILSGVTAYVEVYTDNFNGFQNKLTGPTATLLKSLGARVVRSFNQTVTHVIFNEGRKQIYQQAKDWKIPLVSTLWIERSWTLNSMADPADWPGISNFEQNRLNHTPNSKPKATASNLLNLIKNKSKKDQNSILSLQHGCTKRAGAAGDPREALSVLRREAPQKRRRWRYPDNN